MDYISTTQLVLAFIGIGAISYVFSIFGRGGFFGSRQHTTISEKNIKRGFITILVIAAIWMLIKMVH